MNEDKKNVYNILPGRLKGKSNLEYLNVNGRTYRF
jgi:hypothetical protein